jgi:hypothetical protein
VYKGMKDGVRGIFWYNGSEKDNTMDEKTLSLSQKTIIIIIIIIIKAKFRVATCKRARAA